MTNLRVFALIAAFVCCEVLAGTQPFQLLIFRSTTTSRTTRLRTISNAPGFKDGWADEIYNVQMKLGSPGQFVNLTLDYGWGPTFFFGSGNTPCRNPKRVKQNAQCVRQRYSRNFFNSQRSRSFYSTELNYGFTLESPFTNDCGKFPIAGDLVEDNVSIDKWNNGKLTGGKASFNALPFVFTQRSLVEGILHPHWASDGIFGMAYWNGFFGDTTYSFILKMLEQFDEKVVTVYLGNLIRKEFPAREEPSGWMTFGAKNWEHCDKKWEYVGASWTYGWSVVLDTFKMGSYQHPGRAGVGVFASPTAFMYAPKQARDQIVSLTSAEYDVNKDVYFVDCKAAKSMPDMEFDLQGFKYRVSSAYYARKMYGVKGPNSRKQCVLMIGESNRDDTWFLGTSFNRPYCMLFDFTQNNMKLAFSKALMA